MGTSSNMRIFEKWFDNGSKIISITNWKYIRRQNRIEYPNDPDVNTKRKWGIHTNGSKRGNPRHSCLDVTLYLGHLSINYVNFNYNAKYRK